MNKLQDTIREHSFNETEMRARISQQTQKYTRIRCHKNRNIWISVSVAAAMMFVIAGGVLTYNQSLKDSATAVEAVKYAQAQYSDHPLSYAVACVDINPSFVLYMDINGLVTEIEAVNVDAETLDVSSLIGLPIDDSISGIIDLAAKAGFIISTDNVEDYVIVSTVLLVEENDESDKKQDELDQMIEDGLTEDETLDDTTNVAIIKASQAAMFEARGKDVPMGLYVINGMIENNGEMIPVSEFVSNADHLKHLEDHAAIVKKDKKDKKDKAEETTGSSAAQEVTVESTIPEATKANETNPGHSDKENNGANTTAGSNNGSPSGETPSSTKPENTKPENTKPENSTENNGKGNAANE